MTDEKMAKPQLYMPDTLWHAFRMACMARRISASQVITDFIRHQLDAWQAEERQQPRPR